MAIPADKLLHYTEYRKVDLWIFMIEQQLFGYNPFSAYDKVPWYAKWHREEFVAKCYDKTWGPNTLAQGNTKMCQYC